MVFAVGPFELPGNSGEDLPVTSRVRYGKAETIKRELEILDQDRVKLEELA